MWIKRILTKRVLIPSLIILAGVGFLGVKIYDSFNAEAAGITITSVTPNSGGTAGGNVITITGSGWTKTQLVTNGLVAYYDGINNAGTLTTPAHDDSTLTWKDLSSCGNDLSLGQKSRTDEMTASSQIINKNEWLSDAWHYVSGSASDAQVWFNKNPLCSSFPHQSDSTGGKAYSIQYVVKPNTMPSWQIYMSMGRYNSCGSACSSDGLFASGSGEFYSEWSGNNTNLQGGALLAAGKKSSISFVRTKTEANLYDGDSLVANTTGAGGTYIANSPNIWLGLNHWNDSSNWNGDYEVSSIRIYNRDLTNSEIKQNTKYDNERFLAAPTVTIDGNNCTSVNIISDTEIQCVVPAGTVGAKKVTLSYGGNSATLNNGYTYADFSITSVTPNFGPTTGGTDITITGTGFPYASTSDYTDAGSNNSLIAYYDAIQNAGGNDRAHSSTTTTWKDISGNGYDLTLRTLSGVTPSNAASMSSCGSSSWKNNSFYFGTDNCYFARVPSNPTTTGGLSAIMSKLPLGSAKYTVEFVFDNSQVSSSTNGGIVGWGQTATTNGVNNTRFMSGSTIRHYWWGNDLDYNLASASSSIRTETITFDGSTQRVYQNGAQTDTTTRTGKNTIDCGSFLVGSTTNTGSKDNCATIGTGTDEIASRMGLMAVRIYARALSAAEATKNAAADQKRFIATPTITVDGNVCTEVVVLSSTQMTCKTPAGTAGAKAVKVQYGTSFSATLNNGFTYQDGLKVSISTASSVTLTPNPTTSAIAATQMKYTVSTNYTNGYKLYANTENPSDASLICTTDSSAKLAPTTNNATLEMNKWGWGITGTSDPVPTSWLAPVTNPKLVDTGGAGDTTKAFAIGAKVNMSAKSCTSYTGKLILTVTINA